MGYNDVWQWNEQSPSAADQQRYMFLHDVFLAVDNCKSFGYSVDQEPNIELLVTNVWLGRKGEMRVLRQFAEGKAQ